MTTAEVFIKGVSKNRSKAISQREYRHTVIEENDFDSQVQGDSDNDSENGSVTIRDRQFEFSGDNLFIVIVSYVRHGIDLYAY